MPRGPPLLIFVTAARALLLGLILVAVNPATSAPRSPKHKFDVYWNVPTFMCHKYGLRFEEVEQKYEIVQNSEDNFRGDQIAILYDPGMFPALLKQPDGTVVLRNGGVPQKGDLAKHLNVFKEHLISQIPNTDFNGIGVIDFESWRPTFRQNWASLQPYKDLSIKLVREKYPTWPQKRVDAEAKRVFEKYGKLFMQETLALAKKLRPNARWSYYAFPYCYNLTPSNPYAGCSTLTTQDNDKLSWLFDAEDVILPSVYLRSTHSLNDKIGMVGGRTKEAVRVARKHQKVLNYYWYKYQDAQDKFVNRVDLEATFRSLQNAGGNGIIIWGSSNDFNTKDKCMQFRQYLNHVLGPIIYHMKHPSSSNPSSPTVKDVPHNRLIASSDYYL